MENWVEWLRQAAPGTELRTQEPMSRHTTFQVGGPAAVWAEPGSAAELAALAALCRREHIPYSVVGRGSNLLVGDKGYPGVILHLGERLSHWRTEGTQIWGEAGISLAALARYACQAGLAGLAFAAGIPGSLGGAVFMNAGAYGREMKDVLAEVQVLDPAGRIRWIPAEQMELGYRTSAAQTWGYVITAAKFQLQPGDPAEIRDEMAALMVRRREKQPLEYPSAGSTFKRPAGYFAGKLIQDAGLAGFSVGGAQVSEKHCGFVINRGGATAAEIRELCRQVAEQVRERFGVELELEVRCLGEF